MSYHVVQNNVGLCLYCHKWCEFCNQCGCEIGRKKICPEFDTKCEPDRFERWKIEQEISRVERAYHFGRSSGFKGRRREEYYNNRLDVLEKLLESDYSLFERRDKDGLAYYDR